MLAEVVLRPPDVRHLDAAFQGMAASPRRESSLKVSLGDLYATRCPTCGRMLVAEEFIWAAAEPGARGGRPGLPLHGLPRPARRDRVRQAPLDAEDLVRARRGRRGRRGPGDHQGAVPRRGRRPAARRRAARPAHAAPARRRWPRSSTGSRRDLRAAPVLAALRLAFLHSILPASRLDDRARPDRQPAYRGRPREAARRRAVARAQPVGRLRGRRPPGPRLRPAARQRRATARSRPASARTCGAWGRGPRPRSSALSSPSGLPGPRHGRAVTARRPWHAAAADPARPGPAAAPARPRPARRHVPRDVLGPRPRGGVAPVHRRPGRLVPARTVELAGRGARPGAGGRRAGDGPRRARGPARRRRPGGGRGRGRSAGSGAGYRLISALVGDPNGDGLGIVELLPPGARMPPGAADPRQRAARRRARRRRRPGRHPRPAACSRPRNGSRAGPFSAAEAARTVTEVAVETLRARGEPARWERLLGEILVGLDRAGQLRRLAGDAADDAPADPPPDTRPTGPPSGRARADADGPAAVGARHARARLRGPASDRRPPARREATPAAAPEAVAASAGATRRPRRARPRPGRPAPRARSATR